MTDKVSPECETASDSTLVLQEALWRMRFQIIGNVILLLLFFLYTLWIRYSADQRAAEDHMPGMQNSAQDKTEL